MKRWLALIFLAAVSLAFVLVPAWLIQPFRPQTPRELEVGYWLRAWSPWVTLAAAVLSLAVAALVWRDARRWWKKALLPLLLVPVVAAAWFARQNHFEWMFNPLAAAGFAEAGEAREFVRDEDMVISVEVNGERAAYPVRLLAYHHLVQDNVGGTPLVSTY